MDRIFFRISSGELVVETATSAAHVERRRFFILGLKIGTVKMGRLRLSFSQRFQLRNRSLARELPQLLKRSSLKVRRPLRSTTQLHTEREQSNSSLLDYDHSRPQSTQQQGQPASSSQQQGQPARAAGAGQQQVSRYCCRLQCHSATAVSNQRRAPFLYSSRIEDLIVTQWWKTVFHHTNLSAGKTVFLVLRKGT